VVFDDVTVRRGGNRALDCLSCEFPLAGVTAVTGPSGSGKSTLLRLLNRLEVPSSGQVVLGGRDLSGTDPLALRREVGMVFQRPTPFAGTVADNLRVGAPGLGDGEVGSLLARVGLDGSFAGRDARGLSGGEAQRVCLARTLAVGPRVLLLDEPTSALDPDSVAAAEQTVADLAVRGVAVVWVSHDAGQVARVADRVVHLDRGRCTGTDELGGTSR
jgi:putative ABC transport system ATP-binding protein